MRQRPAKPTKMRLFEGNPGNRPVPENEPTYDQHDVALEAPAWIHRYGREEWERIAPSLLLLGLLDDGSMQPFALYCQHFGLVREAAERVNRDGMVCDTPNGHSHLICARK